MIIVRTAHHELKEIVEVEYRKKGEFEHGFIFSFTKQGVPLFNNKGIKNYNMCMTSNDYVFIGAQVRVKRIYHRAMGICPECGRLLELHPIGATKCKCGSLYDTIGRKLL